MDSSETQQVQLGGARVKRQRQPRGSRGGRVDARKKRLRRQKASRGGLAVPGSPTRPPSFSMRFFHA